MYLDHPVLYVSSAEQLRLIVETETVSWSNIMKLHSGKDLPLFKLVSPQLGNTLSEKVYRTLYESKSCATCGGITKFYSWGKGYAVYCSTKCARNDKVANLEKAKKTMATMLLRHGGTGTLSCAKLREKVAVTNSSRYGETVAIKSPVVKAKAAASNIERYGHSSPAKNSVVSLKAAKTRRDKTAKQRISNQLAEYVDARPHVDGEDREWRCLTCNSVFSHNWATKQRAPICRTCTPMVKGTSSAEQEIASFISAHATTEQNKRFYFDAGKYYELDIFVPSINLGVEYNGLYWHSELAGKDKNYHANKRNFFASQGIRVIMVFEHEWSFKRDICESMLRHRLGVTLTKIHARKCHIVNLSSDEAARFMNKNHIAGSANSAINIGLLYQGEVVTVATFRKDRFGSDKSVFELIRFCNRLNTTVVGGLSKVTTAFLATNRCSIKTFTDLRWGDGNGYIAAGFKFVKALPPCNWYFTTDNQVSHRSVFQKKKLLKLLQSESSDNTEWQLAQQLGLNRYWDCGHSSYILETVNDKTRD
jgi:hypothetical protein